MGDQTRPAPRPPRPHPTGQTDDTARAGESPTTQHAPRARRAPDLARRQPGLDADQISLYRHHQCLRALQRGTLRARQDFSGVPRDPSLPRHTDGAHDQDQPGDYTSDHIGKLNDEWPPRGRHPERRSTARCGWPARVGCCSIVVCAPVSCNRWNADTWTAVEVIRQYQMLQCRVKGLRAANVARRGCGRDIGECGRLTSPFFGRCSSDETHIGVMQRLSERMILFAVRRTGQPL